MIAETPTYIRTSTRCDTPKSCHKLAYNSIALGEQHGVQLGDSANFARGVEMCNNAARAAHPKVRASEAMQSSSSKQRCILIATLSGEDTCFVLPLADQL